MTTLSQYGITATLASGWEGRIYRRDDPPAAGATTSSAPDPGTRADAATAPWSPPTNPILHLANFALPTTVGDYGGYAVEQMTNQHIFVALVEFNAESAGTALFAPTGIPKLKADHFDPNCLQHALAGQGGTQKFFTVNGRPFCLYVVLGSHGRRVRTVPVVNAAIADITIS